VTIESSHQANPAVANVMRPLNDAAGWMKFLGTLSIIYGVLIALTIIGLLIAWLPIWLGVLLRRASDESVVAHRTGDEANAITATTSLQTIFKIYGIVAVIGLVYMGVVLVIAIVAIAAGSGGS
jgi:uncharacterized protein involved in cysteine biosynthesis